MVEFTHKIGDTFRARGAYEDASGNPIDLTDEGVTIKSYVRISSGQRYALTITQDPDGDDFGFFLTASTENWYAGEAEWDVQFTDNGGRIYSSDTQVFRIVRDVTP